MKASSLQRAARPRAIGIFLFIIGVAFVINLMGYSQTPGVRQAATLISGESCYGKDVWCKNPKGRKANGDTAPRLYLVDEKGPENFGRKGGVRGTFNSKWNLSFNLPITPGRHTLTLSAVYTGLGESDKRDASFTAEPGHTYQLDAVTYSGDWTPVITDVTIEGRSHQVAASNASK
jgi:hypothetical protein